MMTKLWMPRLSIAAMVIAVARGEKYAFNIWLGDYAKGVPKFFADSSSCTVNDNGWVTMSVGKDSWANDWYNNGNSDLHAFPSNSIAPDRITADVQMNGAVYFDQIKLYDDASLEYTVDNFKLGVGYYSNGWVSWFSSKCIYQPKNTMACCVANNVTSKKLSMLIMEPDQNLNYKAKIVPYNDIFSPNGSGQYCQEGLDTLGIWLGMWVDGVPSATSSTFVHTSASSGSLSIRFPKQNDPDAISWFSNSDSEGVFLNSMGSSSHQPSTLRGGVWFEQLTFYPKSDTPFILDSVKLGVEWDGTRWVTWFRSNSCGHMTSNSACCVVRDSQNNKMALLIHTQLEAEKFFTQIISLEAGNLLYESCEPSS